MTGRISNSTCACWMRLLTAPLGRRPYGFCSASTLRASPNDQLAKMRIQLRRAPGQVQGRDAPRCEVAQQQFHRLPVHGFGALGTGRHVAMGAGLVAAIAQVDLQRIGAVAVDGGKIGFREQGKRIVHTGSLVGKMGRLDAETNQAFAADAQKAPVWPMSIRAAEGLVFEFGIRIDRNESKRREPSKFSPPEPWPQLFQASKPVQPWG